jgi:sugar phosphate isomerase/epimerase
MFGANTSDPEDRGILGTQREGSELLEVSLSTMWAKGRFSRMAEFAARIRELGFSHVEPNSSVSPGMLNDLLNTGVPISSIHAPCPAVLSSRGIPASTLSLSSLEKSERMEAVGFTKRAVDLAANVGARAVVLHMGEVPIDLSLQDRLYKLHHGGHTQTIEYRQAKEKLIHERRSLARSYVDAAGESLQELGRYGGQKGIMLGLETRFHLNEIPNMAEMAELLDEVSEGVVGYWHDVGHAEVQQQLEFSLHEEWLLRLKDRMVGIHLHDIRGISDHHAPGQGSMNWEMIASYLTQGTIRVCEIGEWNDEEQMQGVVRFLRRKGILD